MPHAYVATYLVRNNLPEPEHPGDLAQAFLKARRCAGADAFPYDAADDPSFFCARHLDGPISWGVCRRDVRSRVLPGDWVVFFSGSKPQAHARGMDYHLVAALQVEATHSGHRLPAPFERYLNRMVRAVDGHTVQDEPALATRVWHDDWLWRLSEGRRGTKNGLVALGADRSVPDSYWDGQGADGKNYIAFHRDAGFVLERPVLVAHKVGADLQEKWLEKPAVRALRDAIFGCDARRYLSTRNRQQPHRHTTRALADTEAWYRAVEVAVAQLR